MTSEEAVDRENPYARFVTIEGKRYYEVGYKGSEEDGYNLRYFEVDSETEPGELRQWAEEAVRDMRDERSGGRRSARPEDIPPEIDLDPLGNNY